MSRTLALRIVFALVAALIVLLVVIALFDWNRAKPWLNARISDATNRPFAINGDLSLQWQRGDDHPSGWSRWIPWPHLQAEDIQLGNPPGLEAKEPFAQVAQLRFSLNPFPLLTRDIVIPGIYLDQARLNLVRTKDEKNNWTLGSDDPNSRSAWEVHIGDVQFHNGEIHLSDALQEIDATVNIDTVPPGPDTTFRTHWSVSGRLQGEKLSGKGRAGALLALRDQQNPFPLEASLKAGATALAIEGKVTGIPSFDEADLKLSLSGDSMAHLYPIIGILLPHTPKFSTRGQLQKAGSSWRYLNFSGKVGQSDLAGDLTVQLDGPRPRLEGQLVSTQLRFQDLGPLAGGGDKENLASDDKTEKQPNDKVLPVREFDTEKWRTLDADVQFRAKRIVREDDLPFENMVTHLKLNDGLLSLSPLNFGMAGGKLTSEVRLDGRKKEIGAAIDLSARGLKLNELFPGVEEMDASIGEMSADAKLTSQGKSVSEMLGASSGEVKALVSEGTISKFLLEAVGLNIGSLILTKLFGDEQVQLHCMATDFEVKQGVMHSRGFIVDTEEAIIRAGGEIDLGKEELNLSIHPENKKLRIVSLQSPIYVQGKFDDPKIGIDKQAITRAGGAVILGLAAPVAAALLPLVDPGEGEEADSGCQRLLKHAQTEPEAPAAKSSSN